MWFKLGLVVLVCFLMVAVNAGGMAFSPHVERCINLEKQLETPQTLMTKVCHSISTFETISNSIEYRLCASRIYTGMETGGLQ